MKLTTFKILISGQVQGVGFRPFVSRLADTMSLTGTVSNNEEGVIIVVTGTTRQIHRFYRNLINDPPVVSRITGHQIRELEVKIFEDFSIIPSRAMNRLNLALTPDFGICRNCSDELSDKNNRRFDYPFTTCVNCGPRWSITRTFPFEREHTTMIDYEMCPVCKAEYKDQFNIRYHSQTNSCDSCGIHLKLEDHQGDSVSTVISDIFPFLSLKIQQGKIVAIKNTSGYLLCCDATNPEVIKRLRQLKKRPKKPLAILYPSLDFLKNDLHINEAQEKELTSPERPIVIISNHGSENELALNELAPGLRQLGVMLPNSGILEILSKHLEQPIVATSGNIHGSPVISEQDDARDLIGGVADYFLYHDLKISNAQDDSVLKFSFKYGQKVLFRRSRGYAPNYLDAGEKFDQRTMALGGHLKSTVAFAPNDYLYISQYLGNLDHFDVYKRFTEMADDFIRIFKVEPEHVLIDMHPGYLSSLYGEELAKGYKIPLFQVQHHKAHFASVLGEHQLFDSSEPILGVVWDGTGYGDDGNIWGGEFFRFDSGEMYRMAFFEYFDWIAGDKMSKEPRLSLYALNEDQDADFLSEKFSKKELSIYKTVKRSNTLKTSSVGRLFDAVASLLNFCDINSYEGEAAILLENSVAEYRLSDLKLYVNVKEDLKVLTRELWNNLYRDHCQGEKREQIVLNFLYTLANLILQMASNAGITKIALSGGVFQNTVLIDMIRELSNERFELFFNVNLAPNDENISYGQFMYYKHCELKKQQYLKEIENERN